MGYLSTLIGIWYACTLLVCKAVQAAGRLVMLLVELHYILIYNMPQQKKFAKGK